MDRRTTIKWVLAALAAGPGSSRVSLGELTASRTSAAKGYGTDPDLVRRYEAGELWPLTFSDAQRRTAAALCGLIIPADEHSPSAAQLQVHVFIDEWISAPYPQHLEDRMQIVSLLTWLDGQAQRLFHAPFAGLDEIDMRTICTGINWTETAIPAFAAAAREFARFRDLTADGFYTTPEGMKDIGYVGNTPLATFVGPPVAALKKAGLVS